MIQFKRTSIEISRGIGPPYPQANWPPNVIGVDGILEKKGGYGHFEWEKRVRGFPDHTAHLTINAEENKRRLTYKLVVTKDFEAVMAKAWMMTNYQAWCCVIHSDAVEENIDLSKPGWYCGKQWWKYVVSMIPVDRVIFPEYTMRILEHSPSTPRTRFHLMRSKSKVIEMVFSFAEGIVKAGTYVLDVEIELNK